MWASLHQDQYSKTQKQTVRCPLNWTNRTKRATIINKPKPHYCSTLSTSIRRGPDYRKIESKDHRLNRIKGLNRDDMSNWSVSDILFLSLRKDLVRTLWVRRMNSQSQWSRPVVFEIDYVRALFDRIK